MRRAITGFAAVPRRDAVVAAAMAVFMEDGFEDASIDAIAKRAHASKTTIYQMFRDKQELFETVVRHTINHARLNTDDYTRDRRAPAVVLNDLARWTIKGFLRPDSLGLYRASIVAATRFPELASELQSYRVRSAVPVISYLAHLAARGDIEIDDPVEAARRLGVLSIDGTRFLLGAKVPTSAQQEEMARRTVALLLGGATALGSPRRVLRGRPPAVAPAAAGRAARRLSEETFTGLLDSAAREFLLHGFTRGNVDQVVADCGVGKMTIRRHFGDKAGLFEAAVRHLVDTSEVPRTDSPPATLAGFLEATSGSLLDAFREPRNLAMYRLMIGEANRFPELARYFYARKVEAPVAAVAQSIGERYGDKAVAAAARPHFVLSVDGNRLLTDLTEVTAEVRQNIIAAASRIILRGYSRT